MSSKPFQDLMMTVAGQLGCGCWNDNNTSSEERENLRVSQKIDRQLKADQRKMQRQVKLLLLGAGESGKSTFLKQMKIIHGVVFEEEQISEYRQIIYSNMIRGRAIISLSRSQLETCLP